MSVARIARCEVDDIFDNENEPRPLYIGLIGYNRHVALMGLKEIRDNNSEQVAKCNVAKGLIELTDGTVIRILTDRRSEGLKLDQLLICDDSRWSVFIEQGYLIDIARDSMITSCVPDEYKIQKYEV